MTATRRGVLRLGLAGAAATLGCRLRDDGRTHIALWFSYGGRNRVVLERMVERYNRSQTEIHVNPVFQGDYYEGVAKLRLALAAKAAPALSHVIGEVVPYLAEAGVLERLDAFAGSTELDVIDELGQAKSWIGGDQRPLVTLPFNRSTPIAYLNADIFERAGLKPPTTWQELRDVAKHLTVRDHGRTERYGFACPISWWMWIALVNQAGSDVVDPEGRVTLGAAAGVEALEFWQMLVHEDKTMKPPAGRDSSAYEIANNDFLSGRAAMIWNSTAFLKYLEDNASFPVLAAALPKGRRFGVPTGGTHFVILDAAPLQHKQAAWRFLWWMHQPEQVIEWSLSTGYMPTTHSAVRRLEQEGHYAAHPNDRVAYDQLRYARPWPWSPELFRIQREVVQPRLEAAVVTNANARELMQRARREV